MFAAAPHSSHYQHTATNPLNLNYDSDHDDENMQMDSDSDAKRDADADADGEYVDDDSTVMPVALLPPARPSTTYYQRDSVRTISPI
jgi:hypothetical protein